MKTILGVIFGACLICHVCSLKVETNKRNLLNYLSAHGGRDMASQGVFLGNTSRKRTVDAASVKKETVVIQPSETYKALPFLTSILNVERYANWTNWSTCDIYGCVQFRHRLCLDDTWTEGKLVPFGNSDCMSKLHVETRECKNKTTCLPTNKVKNCGARPTSAGIMNKVVGGETSKPNTWPWMVRLSEGLDPSNATLICGGTLIAPQWILTAAHCITDSRNLTSSHIAEEVKSMYAHLGDHRTSVSEKTQRYYLVKVAIIHPSFTPGPVNNGIDIALLYLMEPVELEPAVNFACLPNRPVEWNSSNKCYAVGWGMTKASPEEDIFEYIWRLFSRWREYDPNQSIRQPHKSDRMSDELHEVRLPIRSYDECTAHYPGIHEGQHICAGTPGKGTCNGDSGGGLYCQLPNSNKWVITGVTSFGSIDGCGRHPGIYTSVLANEQWILRTISEFHIPLNLKFRPSIMSADI